MGHWLTTTIEGTEYAAESVGGDPDRPSYEGLFTRRSDGTWQQRLGHSQTPQFSDSEPRFRRWVLRHTLGQRRQAREDSPADLDRTPD